MMYQAGINLIDVFLVSGHLKIKDLHTRTDNATETEQVNQWQTCLKALATKLLGRCNSLFPSSRYYSATATALDRRPHYNAPFALDTADSETWVLLSYIAADVDNESQSALVIDLREKALEEVVTARRLQALGSGATVDQLRLAELKIQNVNSFLHALDLDADMIQ